MKNILRNGLSVTKILAVLILVSAFSVASYGETFTVTKIADTNDGSCDADCSLREAIASANTATSDDVIVFDTSVFSTSQTIVLTGGAVTVSGNSRLTIEGTGSNLLMIDCSVNSGINNNGSAAVLFKNFKVTGNSSGFSGRIGNSGNLTLSNLVVMNSPYGTAAVSNVGTMTIENSTLTGNLGGAIANVNDYTNNARTLLISNSNISNNGIGISNQRGRLTITDSTISNNIYRAISNTEGTANLSNLIITGNSYSGYNNDGAGVYAYTSDSVSFPAITNITNSVISGNSVSGENSDGGGVASFNGILTITNSTVSGNTTAGGHGGGIWASGTFNLYNSTVTGNTAQLNGGGIYSLAIANVSGSTINNNSASRGGGIYRDTSLNNAVSALNTIIGDNTATVSSPDFFGTLTSQGYNLIENTEGTIINGTTAGNIVGRDPQLAPLRDNGGATQTVALLPTSPAIDAGNPNDFRPTDERGIARPQDGDLNGSSLPDIGAYERQVSTILTVTKSADTNDGLCDADCSLREAVAELNSSTVPDKAVVFAPSIFSAAQTIVLTLGELELNNTIGTSLIKGTRPDFLTISANNQSRVFFINVQTFAAVENLTVTGGFVDNDLRGGGGFFNDGRASIRNLVIRNNATTSGGGGFFNDGIASVTIIDSVIRDNTASSGGGIGNTTGGNVTVIQSTVSGNRSTDNGGGIYNGGNLLLSNSTISGNVSNRNGGGIYSGSFFNGSVLLNSTITLNLAQQSGGGVYESSLVESGNTIIAGNTSAGANSAPDFDGDLSSRGYNLIGNTARTIISGQTTGNLLSINPQLLPLGNYGGVAPTHALRLSSPAIDKGNNFGTANDQRGLNRPYDFPNISNAVGGNGTDIGAFERQISDSNGNRFFDFDGDGKADVSVFRPENGSWYLNQSSAGFTGLAFGIASDKLVPADYDGDGKTDVAVIRNGTWYLLRSQAGFTGITFGLADDNPVPADYDGDGKADVAVFRPSNGYWYILQSSNNQFIATLFGVSTDKPVPADYDGDGKTDIAVNRNGNWYIQRSQLGFTGILFGDANDKLVPADYDGDGKTDVAVFRPSNGTWYLQRSSAGFAGITFGLGTDIPVAADYDGDGKADLAVVRNGNWYLNRTTQGFTGIQFGTSTDLAIPNAFVR